MAILAQGLIRSRRKRGAIDLEIPARSAVLDRDGKPERIVSEKRLFSHRLIEAFMLSANEAVAQWFDARDLPVIYRVHDKPDAKKLSQCLEIAAPHGFGLKLAQKISRGRQRADVSCGQIADFVDEIKGHSAEAALNSMVLRSMAQAVYSPDNIGHFGLASDAYLHFTSPIRRYPDLEVHRQLKEALRACAASPSGKPRRLTGAARQKKEQLLDAVAGRSSERERAAMAAERDVQSWAAAAVAEKHIGEFFQASVVSITDFGAFAMLEDINVEGLVLPEYMGKSRVTLDTEAQQVILSRKKILTLGSRIRVRIDSVDTLLRHVNLSLA